VGQEAEVGRQGKLSHGMCGYDICRELDPIWRASERGQRQTQTFINAGSWLQLDSCPFRSMRPVHLSGIMTNSPRRRSTKATNHRWV